MVTPIIQGASASHFTCLYPAVQWLGRQISLSLERLKSALQRIWERVKSIFVKKPEEPTVRTFHPVSKIAVSPYDPAVHEAQSFLTNFTSLATNSVYNHKIAPIVSAYAGNATQLSTEVTSTLNSLTTSLAKTISTAIVGAIDDAASAATGEVKTLLTWLIHGKSIEDTLNAIESTLSKTFKPGLVSEFMSWIKDKTWFQASAPIPSLKSACPSAEQDGGVLQSLLFKAIQALITNKVATYLQTLNQSLGGQVGQVLQQNIQRNSSVISQILSIRLSKLIQASAPLSPPPNLPTLYQRSYDDIVKLLYNHVNAIVKASKTANAANLAQEFSKDEACDPNVSAILNPPPGFSVADETSRIEQKVCANMANRLIALLLPNPPGVVDLMNRLQFPAQLQNAFNDLLTLPITIIPAGATPTLELVERSVKYFFEKGAAAIVTDQIAAGLTQGLRLGTQFVVEPAYLKMWMQQGAFPAIIQALIQAILSNVLNNPSEDIVNAFIPLASPSCDRLTVIMQSLVFKVYTAVSNVDSMINLRTINRDPIKFGQQMTPYFNQVADYLVQNTPEGQTPNANTVRASLIAFTNPVDAGANSAYGKLLRELLLDVGKIKLMDNQDLAQFVCQHFLEGLMSKAMTSALNPLRQNEQLLLSGIVTGISGIMSTQAQVDELFFAPSTPPVDVTQQLDGQLELMSKLINSLMRQAIDQLPRNAHWYSSPFKHLSVPAIKAFLPSQINMSTAIKTIYHTILDNGNLNKSLYFQAARIILTSFENASNQV